MSCQQMSVMGKFCVCMVLLFAICSECMTMPPNTKLEDTPPFPIHEVTEASDGDASKAQIEVTRPPPAANISGKGGGATGLDGNLSETAIGGSGNAVLIMNVSGLTIGGRESLTLGGNETATEIGGVDEGGNASLRGSESNETSGSAGNSTAPPLSDTKAKPEGDTTEDPANYWLRLEALEKKNTPPKKATEFDIAGALRKAEKEEETGEIFEFDRKEKKLIDWLRRQEELMKDEYDASTKKPNPKVKMPEDYAKFENMRQDLNKGRMEKKRKSNAATSSSVLSWLVILNSFLVWIISGLLGS